MFFGRWCRRYFAYFTAVGTTFYTTVKVNVSDIYASTDSVHVLDLIGSDYTAFGIDFTAYLCNVSSDMYEYDTSTRLIRVQFIVQPSLEIATCLVYLSSWLRRLRALPSGPTALTTGRRDRTGIFVFIWCELA